MRISLWFLTGGIAKSRRNFSAGNFGKKKLHYSVKRFTLSKVQGATVLAQVCTQLNMVDKMTLQSWYSSRASYRSTKPSDGIRNENDSGGRGWGELVTVKPAKVEAGNFARSSQTSSHPSGTKRRGFSPFWIVYNFYLSAIPTLADLTVLLDAYLASSLLLSERNATAFTIYVQY